MIFKSQKLAIYSYLLNVVFLLTAAFFVIKRWHFQFKLDHPAIPPSYLNNPQYREQMNIEPAYIRPDDIIIMGTSHVYKAHWDELLHRSDIGNRGIGSDVTEGFLHRLRYVLDTHPRICFIEGGENDIALHIPTDKIISNFGKLVDTLANAHICPVIHTIFHVAADYPGSGYINERITSVNKRIVQLAVSRNIECIDLNTEIAPRGVLLPQYSQFDRIHLNARAYIYWADEIKKVLNEHHI